MHWRATWMACVCVCVCVCVWLQMFLLGVYTGSHIWDDTKSHDLPFGALVNTDVLSAQSNEPASGFIHTSAIKKWRLAPKKNKMAPLKNPSIWV